MRLKSFQFMKPVDTSVERCCPDVGSEKENDIIRDNELFSHQVGLREEDSDWGEPNIQFSSLMQSVKRLDPRQSNHLRIPS